MNEIFNKTYQNYLKQLEGLDLSERGDRLGLEVIGGELSVPLFGIPYRVSSSGVISEKGLQAGFSESVVIFKYILMCPEPLPGGFEWAAYHSFKDAQPLLNFFAREVTAPIEKHFAGRMGNLEEAGKKLGGASVKDAAAFDFSMEFEALSKIPLFLRFNDEDEDFPARCTVLFKSSVEKYLDMESLGILGAMFTKSLIGRI